jgi:hypothetical protein
MNTPYIELFECPVSGKRGYSTRQEADSAMMRINSQRLSTMGVLKDVYYCLYCNSYHLSSRDPKNKKLIIKNRKKRGRKRS